MLTLTYVLICFYSNVVNKKTDKSNFRSKHAIANSIQLRVGSKQGNKNRSDSRAVGSK